MGLLVGDDGLWLMEQLLAVRVPRGIERRLPDPLIEHRVVVDQMEVHLIRLVVL